MIYESLFRSPLPNLFVSPFIQWNLYIGSDCPSLIPVPHKVSSTTPDCHLSLTSRTSPLSTFNKSICYFFISTKTYGLLYFPCDYLTFICWFTGVIVSPLSFTYRFSSVIVCDPSPFLLFVVLFYSVFVFQCNSVILSYAFEEEGVWVTKEPSPFTERQQTTSRERVDAESLRKFLRIINVQSTDLDRRSRETKGGLKVVRHDVEVSTWTKKKVNHN